MLMGWEVRGKRIWEKNVEENVQKRGRKVKGRLRV